MQVFNIRKGLATNSSSSHSMIRFRTDDGVKGIDDDEHSDMHYGESGFTLASTESKRRFAAALLIEDMQRLFGIERPWYGSKAPWIEGIKECLTLAGVEITIENIVMAVDREVGVDCDRGSVVDQVPLDPSGRGPDKAFWHEFMALIDDPKVVILCHDDTYVPYAAASPTSDQITIRDGKFTQAPNVHTGW